MSNQSLKIAKETRTFRTISNLSTPVGVPESHVITSIIFQCEGKPIRYRADGTAPTATVGLLVPVGEIVELTLDSMVGVSFIEVEPSATLNIATYF